MNKKTLLIILTIIVVVVGILVYVVFATSKLEVERISLQNRDVIQTVSANGIVKSDQDYSLAFKTSGLIKSIDVKTGDTVTKGQTLAVVDSLSVQNTIQAYKDARDIALRERDLFISQYANDVNAIGGRSEYDIRIRKLNEQISQAEANYKAQSSGLRDYTIKSPIDGTIIDVSKNVGEIAGLNEPIIAVARLDLLNFEVQIDQEDFGQLRIGQDVKIELDSYADKTFNGKIKLIPNFANLTGPNADLFKIEIEFIDADINDLKLGMLGDASIIVRKVENTPSLVFDQIYEEIIEGETKKYVWVVENDTLQKKVIQTKLEGDIYTAIETDLSNDVIVFPTIKDGKYENGTKIKFKQAVE